MRVVCILGWEHEEERALCTVHFLSQACVQGRDAVVWLVQADPSVLLGQDQKMENVHELERKGIPNMIKASHHSGSKNSTAFNAFTIRPLIQN